MTNDFARIEELFHKAMSLPSDQREAFLRDLEGEGAIAEEVKRLVVASSGAGEMFDHRTWMGRLVDEPVDPRIGSLLGAWRVERQLGAGGMGAVYLAERADGQFQMRAAVKIVRLGLDSQSMLRRFYRERQILAQLEHPNIARLVDGGVTPDNYPYLVLEFIEGEGLDVYCERARLNLRQKLMLFRKLCSAVKYLHSNLIVHCDLKPSNVLVTTAGEPKLLDFGIARLAEDSETGPHTATAMVFTPRYASPEQVLGKPITTKCDVYSLGVILYELLTGANPYGEDQRTPAGWMEAVGREPVRPPSIAAPGVAAELKGEVEQILLKALAKDPAERYASVEQFDEDIGRYLEGLPVLAQPHSVSYRLRKFVYRNRTAVFAGAAIVLTLIGGLIATTYESRVAERERARAERRFEDVRRLTRLILFDFHDGVMNIPGSTRLQRELVAKTLTQLEPFARDAAGDPRLMAELAESYLRLGDVQGNPYWANLGDPAAAVQTYSKGLRLLEPVPEGTGPSNMERARAMLYCERGALRSTRGEQEQAANDLERAKGLLERLVRSEPQQVEHRLELANVLFHIGDAQGGNAWTRPVPAAEVIAMLEQSLHQWREALQRSPENQRAKRGVALTLYKISEIEMEKQPAKALEHLRAAIAMLDSMSPEDRQLLSNRRLVSTIRVSEGSALAGLDRIPEALNAYAASLKMRQEFHNADPSNRQVLFDLVTVYRNRGDIYKDAKRYGEAVTDYRKAAALIETLLSADAGNIRLRDALAQCWLLSGKANTSRGNVAEAYQDSQKGLRIREELANAAGAEPQAMLMYAFSLLEVEPASLRDRAGALTYYLKARASGKPVPPALDQWIADLRQGK